MVSENKKSHQLLHYLTIYYQIVRKERGTIFVRRNCFVRFWYLEKHEAQPTLTHSMLILQAEDR